MIIRYSFVFTLVSPRRSFESFRRTERSIHSTICRHSKRLDSLSLSLSLVFRTTIARKAQRGKERTDLRATAVRDARGFPQAHSVCLSTKEDEERREGGGGHHHPDDDFQRSAKESKSNSSKQQRASHQHQHQPRGRSATPRTESLRPIRVSENRCRAERAPVSRRANRKRAFTTDVLLYLRGGRVEKETKKDQRVHSKASGVERIATEEHFFARSPPRRRGRVKRHLNDTNRRKESVRARRGKEEKKSAVVVVR